MTTALSLSHARATRETSRNSPVPWWFDGLAIGVLAFCALLLHRDGLTGGPAFYELDTRLFYFPLAQWVAQQLQTGSLPLWLPGIFTGYPIFADGELGLAYLPQVVLLAALPTPLAMVWLRALHVFLAGVFTYAFLRTLRLEPLPSLGGALTFAFGSFLTAQMHHENVIRSAVWLPAVLLCLERAAYGPARSAVAWAALGALAFAQSALGLHVQPVLMAALAIGGYALFRLVVAPRKVLASVVAIIGGGLAVAAVQWLPLGEWALVSSRRGGVDYEFASAFAVAPVSLVSVILPFFFRLSDATTWWSLWQQWETELYVGIPALSLAVTGIVLSRRVELVYFVVLAILSLWIGMAEYAPLFNLHHVLWSIPGFSFLRAPGRFTYLTVFALACLAALGLQALGQHRLRLVVALVGGVPAIALLAALLAILPSSRSWLVADPTRAAAWAQSTYLATRAQYPIDPALVVTGFITSLDIGNVKTVWALVLLALTCLAFVAWLALSPRRLFLSQAIFVALIAVDLLTFASDFHPRLSLADLAPPPIAASGQRVLMHDPVDLPAFEPNQPLAEGIPMAQGYSSLPSQRHVELDAATSVDPRLFDLWSAPIILEPSSPADLRAVDGVRFRSEHPLASTFGGAAPQVFRFPPGSVTSFRIVGTLSYAFNAPQGETVATLTLADQTLPIRAGIELSERAYDRASLAGLVKHRKAPVALDFDEATPEGEAYMAHLYKAEIPLATGATSADSLAVASIDPSVRVDLYGVGLVAPDGSVTSLDISNRDGLQQISSQVIQNGRALPRAYALPRSQAFSPARHPGLTATQLVASPDVDLHSMVLIENDPAAPSEPQGSAPLVPAAKVEDVGPNTVRVTVEAAAAPSYVVLNDFYHRGWTAHVDGQSARVFIANALFRAVAVEPGVHVVEFRFEPLSHVAGAATSLLSLVVLAAAMVWGLRRPR